MAGGTAVIQELMEAPIDKEILLSNDKARNLLDHYGSEYCSNRVVHAKQLNEACTWTTKHGSLLSAQPGDWLLKEGGQEWTVARNIFEKTYTACGEGEYVKSAPIRAVKLDAPAVISTLEGESEAKEGDYLASNPEGDIWPIPAEEFERVYRPVEKKQ